MSELSDMKSDIVNEVLQAARLKTMGYYVDSKGMRNLVGFNDREDLAVDHMTKALSIAQTVLMCVTSTIDTTVEA